MSSTPDVSLAARLLARLHADTPDHARFLGAPVDIAEMTALELGSLWAAIGRARRPDGANPAARALADAILEQAAQRELVPALDRDAALEVLRATAAGEWERALECLSCLADAAPKGCADELLRILGDPADWAGRHYEAYALARLAGPDTLAQLRTLVVERHRGSPFVLLEFEVLPQLGQAALLALADSPYSRYWRRDLSQAPDPALVLGGEAAYIAFAREALDRAASRIDDIYSARVAYVADAAFSVDDAGVIARAARVAAHRDESWFGALIVDLLPKVCVAPTSARTAPSQSLAIALGHAIEGVPTPESVQALHQAHAEVRHAGVKKKLARNLKPAERALAERPELALRLSAGGWSDKRQRAILASCLESGFWRGFELSMADWRARLAENVQSAPFARALVWLANDDSGARVSFMFDGAGPSLAAHDSGGRVFRLADGGRVTLWHPAAAGAAERSAWQARLGERALRQPIRQVFREHYPAPAEQLTDSRCDVFGGHMLSLRPLIGLARREGWQVDQWDGLVRQFGALRLTFAVGARLYPGAQGSGESGRMCFESRQGSRWQPIAIGQIDPVVFSEACRAVDLLVSVAGFALDEAQPDPDAEAAEARPARLAYLAGLNLSRMAAMRREVLRQAFAAPIAAGTLLIDERHARIGPHAIHLATGRVSRAGAALALALPAGRAKLAALPWLPYDEVLLEKIAGLIGLLLAIPDDGAAA